MTIIVSIGDYRNVESIMSVMDAAFDPEFGEAWTAAQCAGLMIMPGATLCVAHEGTEIVGFALLRSILEEAELLLIATHPKHRRRGVAKSLIEFLFNYAKSQGVRSVFLEVREGNDAISLYKFMGFTQVGRRTNYYKGLENKQFDALSLRANL